MCDTLCMLGPGGTVFAKNSDRPPFEVQLVSALGARPPGGVVKTQYLEIPDAGAARALMARPTWLWGAEHGVNEHGVAVGNEKIYTARDPAAQPPALIGMDLVRLALERARSAEEALEVVTGLLAAHGQGGVGDATHQEAYFSSFLLADRARAWVLETSGRTWAARPVTGHAAISNRIALRTDWTRGSPDLPAGADFDAFRKPDQLTGDADLRLAAAARFLAGADAGGREPATPAAVVAHLRDHGHGPWGAPGAGDAPDPPPAELLADFTGISVCMHVRGYMATTSSMVASLPTDPEAPLRAWVAPGSPCVSVFVPVFPPAGGGGGRPRSGAVAAALADEGLWEQVRRIRDGVEAMPERIAEVREVLDPLEAELWAEADQVAEHPDRWPAAVEGWGRRVLDAVDTLVGAF